MLPLLSEIIAWSEDFAPLSLCEPYDNSGLIAGDDGVRVERALVCLDVTPLSLAEAARAGAQLVVSHHPPYLAPIKTVTRGAPASDVVFRAVRDGVALLCMHTNFDAARPGVSDALCEALGCAPGDALEPRGERAGYGLGRMCELAGGLLPRELAARARERLTCGPVQLIDCGRPVRRVCVIGGSGGDAVLPAARAGADLLVTGELKHHEMLLAAQMGLGVLLLGHHNSERPAVPLLARLLGGAFPEMSVTVSAQSAPYLVV